MDKNELYRLIQQKEKENERNTFKRFIYTVIIHAVILFVILCATDGIAGVGVLELVCALAGCAIAGVLIVSANAAIYGYLAKKNAGEKRVIENLKKQLNEMDNNQ